MQVRNRAALARLMWPDREEGDQAAIRDRNCETVCLDMGCWPGAKCHVCCSALSQRQLKGNQGEPQASTKYMPGGAEVFHQAWQSSFQAVSILLNLRFLRSMRGWIDKTHRAQREVGGLFLGRLERGRERASITVESCEPMHISHHPGPEFALTDGEQNLLELDAADNELLQGAAGQTIYLLVRPVPDYTAASFSGRGEGLERRLSALPAPAFANWRLSQWIAAVAACLFIALAGAGYYWQQSRTVAGPRGLGLNVHQTGKELRLTWNPRALHGLTVLVVGDGAFQRRIRLNPEEIEHGSALYIPRSNQVSFRLETDGVADSIWLVPSAAPSLKARATQEKAARMEAEPGKTAAVKLSKPDRAVPARVAPKLIPATLVAPKKMTRPEQAPVAEGVRIMPAIAKQEAPKLAPPASPKTALIAPPPSPAAPIAVPEPVVTVSYTASPEAAGTAWDRESPSPANAQTLPLRRTGAADWRISSRGYRTLWRVNFQGMGW